MTDDEAVDSFANAMKIKLRKKRVEDGRDGWQDAGVLSTGSLAYMLLEHVVKGDPVDIANFAMMLWHRDGQQALKDCAAYYTILPIQTMVDQSKS